MRSTCGAGEKTLQSTLEIKQIKPVNLKGNQRWILIGRTDAEAPVFWSPNVNSRLIGKVPDAGKDWGQKEKRATEDELAGRYHWCNGHELGQTLGDGEGQGGLACCRPWGHRVGHNWVTEKQHSLKRVCLWHMAWLTSAFWMEYFSFFPFNFLSHISSPCYLYFLMDILSIYNIPSIFQPASVSRHWKDTFSVSSEKIRTK